MSRALLALAFGLLLGNPAAPFSWVSSLVEVTLSSTADVGNQWDPNGVDTGGSQPSSDVGSRWDPDGRP